MRKLVRPIGWRILAIPLVAALLFACATTAPFEAKDLSSIVGKWQGFANHQTFGPFFMRLTVRNNGDWQMTSDVAFYQGFSFAGTVWVNEGGKFQSSSQTPGLSGTYTLYRGEKERWLSFRSDDGSVSAELRPY